MGIYKNKYYPASEKQLPPKTKVPANFQSKKRSLGQLKKKQHSNSKGTSTPNLIHRVLTKMAYGPSAADVSHIQSLPGATDQDKVINYIDEQLNPGSITDTALDAMLTNGFTTLNKTRIQLYQDHLRDPMGADIDWEDHIRPGRETVYATFLKGIHSKKQLLETLADFWHNHFNIYLDSDGVPAMFVNYDRDVIRANALGNFRQMLLDVTQSTCMLAYLGNGVNELTAPNENYARELMELHTLGADNYYTHLAWDEVPLDNEGRRVGYVEEDVIELARALTGWSFSGADWWDYQNGSVATGEFIYRDSWHDQGTKRVLGINFEHDTNNPMKDVNDILDTLAEHPATANFIATKLCKRFISDTPGQSIIDQVAETFHDNWQSANQIQLTMEVLLKSSDFLNTWGEKLKRPLERTISAMRQIEYSFPYNPNEDHSGWHYWGFLSSGQSPFYWTSPNGYPDSKADWMGSSTTMSTWRYIQWVCHFDDPFDNVYNNILAITETEFPNLADRTPNNIVNFWFERACGAPPDAHTQDKLAEFMSRDSESSDTFIDRNTAIDLSTNSWPNYNIQRLYAVVSTIFMTSDFIQR